MRWVYVRGINDDDRGWVKTNNEELISTVLALTSVTKKATPKNMPTILETEKLDTHIHTYIHTYVYRLN